MDLQAIRAAVRGHGQELILPENTVYTAVLIPLVEKEGQLHVLFELRSANVAQGGEVSFPGGHLEPGEDAAQAVVREACEELLVEPGQVELLAPMHRLADRGRLIVDSWLGVLHGYEGTRSDDEVAQVFTVPLDWFLENPPEIHSAELSMVPPDDFPYELIPGGRSYPFYGNLRQFYFYRTQPAVIWGLTADLLYHAIEYLKGTR